MMIFQNQDRRQSRLAGNAYRWSFKYDDNYDELDRVLFWDPRHDSEMDSDPSVLSAKSIKFGRELSYVGPGRMSVSSKASRSRQDGASQRLVSAGARNLHDEYTHKKIID